MRKYFLYGLTAVILIACNVSDPFDTVEFHERGDRVAELTENISHVQDLGTVDIAIYSPSTPIKYVLEINGGISQVAGIQIGQQVRFLGNIQTKFGC